LGGSGDFQELADATCWTAAFNRMCICKIGDRFFYLIPFRYLIPLCILSGLMPPMIDPLIMDQPVVVKDPPWRGDS
jgi:hypothetical protein